MVGASSVYKISLPYKLIIFELDFRDPSRKSNQLTWTYEVKKLKKKKKYWTEILFS